MLFFDKSFNFSFFYFYNVIKFFIVYVNFIGDGNFKVKYKSIIVFLCFGFLLYVSFFLYFFLGLIIFCDFRIWK